MLRILAFDKDKNPVVLPGFKTLKLQQEENVPCASLAVDFPYFSKVEAIHTLKLFKGDECFFDGICDEIVFEKSHLGNIVSLSLRDKMSLLIDNEALPASFKNITPQVIYDRYIKKLGFDGFSADNSFLSGEFLIEKGTSVYDVLLSFCKTVYNSTPVVSHNKIIFNPKKVSAETVFSNISEGINYYKIKASKYPVNLISKVNVKTSHKDFYTTVKNNAFAQSKGIVRERYLDACNVKTPMSVADRMILNGNGKFQEYKVYVNDFTVNSILEKCKIIDSFYGTTDNLYISKILSKCSDSGSYTEITLKKEADYVAS